MTYAFLLPSIEFLFTYLPSALTFKTLWLIYAPPTTTIIISAFCSKVFVFCMPAQSKAMIHLNNFSRLGYVMEDVTVYSVLGWSCFDVCYMKFFLKGFIS
jgi:hypothetical protein